MTKTPEQMAEEFSKFEATYGVGSKLLSFRQGLFEGFLGGYQAAKDQVADADKVMDTCEHILDMEKMVDVNSSKKLDGWISVKNRLPEEGVGWTMVYGCILSRWSVQPGCYDRQRKEWISRFINGYEDEEGYARLESVTHWHPLPEAPKEEK